MKSGVYLTEDGRLFELERGASMDEYYLYESNRGANWYYSNSQFIELKIYLKTCEYLGKL
jgi:hypothetical protein